MTDKFEDLKNQIQDVFEEERGHELPHFCEVFISDVVNYLASQGRIVPEGWVAVPLEPTLKMKETAEDYRYDCTLKTQSYIEDVIDFGKVYKTMITARPKYKDVE